MITNSNVTCYAVQTAVTIEEHDVIKITLDELDVSNHFYNQPIYRGVSSFQKCESPQR